MKNPVKWVLYCLLVLLFLLHNDFWFWETPQLVLGMPIGLLYHIGYCLVASGTDGSLRQSTRGLGRE